MSAFFSLWQRELTAFFRTSIGSITGAFFLLVTGSHFWMLVGRLAREPAEGSLSLYLFGSPWFWPAMLLTAPLLTMRLFAEEQRMGTLETLMTAPVTETQVVLAKFAGAYSVFLLFWMPTLSYGGLLRWTGISLASAGWGPVATGYLGAFLIGAFYIATGLICSLATRHQIVAAISCLAIQGLLLSTGWLPSPTWSLPSYVGGLSPVGHMADFASGIVDTRAVIGYVSASVLLLFMTIRLLEARRLR